MPSLRKLTRRVIGEDMSDGVNKEVGDGEVVDDALPGSGNSNDTTRKTGCRQRGSASRSSHSFKVKKVGKRKQQKQKQLLLTMKDKECEDEYYWKKIKQDDSRKERREKMKLCFARNKVEMQVAIEDLMLETEDSDCDDMADGVLILSRSLAGSAATTSTAVDTQQLQQGSTRSEVPGEVVDGSSDGRCEQPPTETTFSNSNESRTVPNCCIICLDQYKVGETVVWSSGSQGCPHAFHRTCIIKYLDKIHKRVARTPCPCCRRDFTDLQVEARRKKKGIPLLLSQIRRQFRSSSTQPRPRQQE